MILAIDIGTSFFKSALWEPGGRLSALAKAPLPAGAGSEGAAAGEISASVWLSAFESCASRLGDLSQVGAVVISGNGPTLVPVLGAPACGEGGLSLDAGPARLWLDRRAAKEAELVSEEAGGFVDAGFFLPKALNIKNEAPALYEKTKVFLGCAEFLAYALCGQARAVFPSRGFDRWFWSRQILEKLALDAAKFPPFISAADTFGHILPAVARRFGFAKSVPVIAGGPDFFSALAGSGVCKVGQACDRAGTSEGINVCTQSRIDDWRLFSYGHPVKPLWNLSGVISTTGKAVEWAMALLGARDFEAFSSLAARSPAGARGMMFLPHLSGERSPYWDAQARGVWRGLSLSCGREEAARSVLEGIGFAMRDVITVMACAGAAASELRVTGSAAANGLLNQIKADITGTAVLTLSQKEAELSGLAMIGSFALGEYSSLAEAAGVFVSVEKEFPPSPETRALYGDLFDQYRETYRSIRRSSPPLTTGREKL